MPNLALIVEGHGEVEAAPILVRRILQDLQRFDVTIERPMRVRRSRLGDNFSDLERAVEFVAISADVVLLLVDADDDCPAQLGPTLQARMQAVTKRAEVVAVLANREYESWFLAGIESLRGSCGIPEDAQCVPDAESIRGAKERLDRLMGPDNHYSETVDQPRLAARLDYELARMQSASLDKLVRELVLKFPRLTDGELSTDNA